MFFGSFYHQIKELCEILGHSQLVLINGHKASEIDRLAFLQHVVTTDPQYTITTHDTYVEIDEKENV